MKTEEIILNNFILKYPIERLAPLDQILFLDKIPVSAAVNEAVEQTKKYATIPSFI